MNKTLYFLAETRDDGKTFKLHTGMGYWTDENKAKLKAEQLTRAENNELTRFEVFTIYPYED